MSGNSPNGASQMVGAGVLDSGCGGRVCDLPCRSSRHLGPSQLPGPTCDLPSPRQAIKDELKDQQRPVSSVLDQVQDVTEKGGDVLSKDETKQLDKNGRELRQRSAALPNSGPHSRHGEVVTSWFCSPLYLPNFPTFDIARLRLCPAVPCSVPTELPCSAVCLQIRHGHGAHRPAAAPAHLVSGRTQQVQDRPGHIPGTYQHTTATRHSLMASRRFNL